MYCCSYNSSLLLHGRNRHREAKGLPDHISEDEISNQNHPAILYGFALASMLKLFQVPWK